MTTHLTDTQKQTIRIALAEHQGWQRITVGKTWVGEHPRGSGFQAIPNYPASLDACHEIEVKLTDEEHNRFQTELCHVVNVEPMTQMELRRAYLSASAEHRALALFRALNLGELGD